MNTENLNFENNDENNKINEIDEIREKNAFDILMKNIKEKKPRKRKSTDNDEKIEKVKKTVKAKIEKTEKTEKTEKPKRCKKDKLAKLIENVKNGLNENEEIFVKPVEDEIVNVSGESLKNVGLVDDLVIDKSNTVIGKVVNGELVMIEHSDVEKIVGQRLDIDQLCIVRARIGDENNENDNVAELDDGEEDE